MEVFILRNTSIPLGDHCVAVIDKQILAGRYGLASDVVRAGLRLLEEHAVRVQVLQAALVEGEEAGPATPSDFDAFVARRRIPEPR